MYNYFIEKMMIKMSKKSDREYRRTEVLKKVEIERKKGVLHIYIYIYIYIYVYICIVFM